MRKLVLTFLSREQRIPAYAGVYILSAFLFLSTKMLAQPGPGIANVTIPSGGFHIDGNLQANTPTVGKGDWLAGATGSGGYVLNSNATGTPVNSSTTYHLYDKQNSSSDDNFAGGLKFDDNPNGWSWVSNPVGAKVDIENALFHFARSSDGHQWLIVAADRRSNSGDAYIDFEFLQNTLSVTGTTGGKFISAGPDSGRTVKDFAITLLLTKGGSTAGFFVNRWEKVGSKFDYVDRTSLVPAGAVYAAVNTSAAATTFDAFGGSSYAINTFAEAAVDLTALLGSFDPCTELAIKTIFIKTKESSSPSATIVDFITPQQVSLILGLADAGADQTKCSGGSSTSFSLSGTATPVPGDAVSSVSWSFASGTGTISNATSLTTAVANVTSSSASVVLTVNTTLGCHVRDTLALTVRPGPTVGTGSYGPYCIDAPQVTLGGTPSGGTWTGTGVSQVSGVYKFNPSTAGAGTFTLTYSFTDANSGCSNTATTSVTVNSKPAVTSGSYGPYCIDAAAATLGGTPSGGTWSGTGVSLVGGAYKFNPATAGAGTFTLTYSFSDANTCSNTATTSVTVNAKPTLTPGSYGPYCIDAAAATLGGTPAGGTWSGTGVSLVGGVYKFNPATAGAGTFTLTYSYSDANTCSNTATTSVTVNAKPTLTPGSYGPYCIDAAAATLGGSPTGGTWSGTGVSLVGGVYKFNPATAGAGTFTLTYSYSDANTCSNTATTSVTVNAKPNLTAGSYGPYCIDASTATLGGTPAGGAWSGTGVSLVGGVYKFNPATAGAGTFTLTYSYSDANTCSNTATTSVTVNAKPTLTPGSYGPYCIDASAATLGGTPSGGTWSGTGVSLVGGVYKFNPASAGAGTFTLTYSFTDANTCNNTATTSVTVNSKPTVTPGSYGPYCVDAAAATLAGTPSGGTWSGTGVSLVGGVYKFNPATAGAGTFTLTYSFSDANTCNNTATTSVTVNAKPATPSTTFIAPTTCTQTTYSVSVQNLGNGTYTLTQPNETPKTFVVPTDGTNVLFTGLILGKGYSVTYQNSSNCVSDAATCGLQETTTTAGIQSERLSNQTETQTTVKAYPNPFSDRIKFVVTSPVAGKGNLEVYNMMGQRVKTVYQGYIAAGTQTFELSLPTQQIANLVYVLRIGDKKTSGKILQINQ